MNRSKPLKRTRMKRSRKTPRHQNPDMRQEYRELNPDDEWSKYLPGIEVWVGRPVDMTKVMEPELNHIFHRRDDVSNVIMLSAYHHRWFHRHIQAGRVLCMLVKCLKGEVDIAFWEKASGKKVVTWIESLGEFYAPGDWMHPYWSRLVDQLKGVAQ